jgi:hypothetical protein
MLVDMPLAVFKFVIGCVCSLYCMLKCWFWGWVRIQGCHCVTLSCCVLTALICFKYLCMYCILAYDNIQSGRWTPGYQLCMWALSSVCEMEIKALCCSEVLLRVYQTTWDHNINRHCCESLNLTYSYSHPSNLFYPFLLSIHISMYQFFCVYLSIWHHLSVCCHSPIQPFFHLPTHISTHFSVSSGGIWTDSLRWQLMTEACIRIHTSALCRQQLHSQFISVQLHHNHLWRLD